MAGGDWVKTMASRSDKITQHTRWSSWSQRMTAFFSLLANTKSQHTSFSAHDWTVLGPVKLEKSAVAEHAWENHHPIYWEDTTVLDQGRGQELLVKKSLHIQMTSSEERFNRDGGQEVPGCWTAVMRRQEGLSNPHWPLISNDVSPQ